MCHFVTSSSLGKSCAYVTLIYVAFLCIPSQIYIYIYIFLNKYIFVLGEAGERAEEARQTRDGGERGQGRQLARVALLPRVALLARTVLPIALCV